MFCPYKNSYLQLVCAMNPRVINKAVDQAMQKRCLDPHTEIPPAQRLESMQPSLYAPHVDITRARLGFGRIGLRIIIRELHSKDHLIQLQALHSLLDQVQISENAMFLINLHLVYRLIDLMANINPVIREKVCLIYTHLATYHQGRKQILSRPQIIYNLMGYILKDRTEIRFAAACTLRTLSRDRCSVEVVLSVDKVAENLLRVIKTERTGIILLHLKTLENLFEWDQEHPLKANAFQIMRTLFYNEDWRIVAKAMDCMTQLCKHEIGQRLADEYDLTFMLKGFVRLDNHIEVIISAVGSMAYSTLTTRSKWRAKEFINDLTKRLVPLLVSMNKPLLQLRIMQVLVNLCDCPDIRNHMKQHWLERIRSMEVRTHEEWDGTSETSSYGLETGHNYRTMCIEKVETIRNEFGDNALVLNVHSYLRRLSDIKERLIRAINYKCYL